MLLVARYRALHMATLGFFDHIAPGSTVADAAVKWQALPNSLFPPAGAVVSTNL